MAQDKKDVITPAVKKGAGPNTGTQHIGSGSDFGAREAWDAACNPPSVKEMVGKAGEFAKYKHDRM